MIGNPYCLELQFNNLVLTTTTLSPIFDTRLACSNWSSDQCKIDQVRNFLRIWGFDPSTLGREVTALSPFGRGLNISEKERASGGDSFIGVLTSRDISLKGNERIPPSWTHTESGLTFEAEKPIMAFIEYGVRAEGIYANLDDFHIIRFNPLRPYSDLIFSKNKIINFRQECINYRSN